MSNDDWEDTKEEICTHLQMGLDLGESELETMTRLIWTERQKNVALCVALETIMEISTAALERERSVVDKKAVILRWRKSGRKIPAAPAGS